MIGIVIREMPFLKVLTPIIREIHAAGAPYVLFYNIKAKPGKGYACPTLDKLKASAKDIVYNAQKVIAFSNNDQLVKQCVSNHIKKFVSLEVWLCDSKLHMKLRDKKIKMYSVQYLTDSLWQKKASIVTMDRVYFASKYIMDLHHEFSGAPFDSNRDKFLGCPLFDVIEPNNGSGDILVLTPNIRREHVGQTFGSSKNFVKIIEKLSSSGNLIFKTRKKQWLPEEVKKYAKDIFDDGDIMYPSVAAKLLKGCHTTVLFYSSGIYESIMANNYVLNIAIPLDYMRWDKRKKKRYYQSGELYNFKGVIESVDQETILKPSWNFNAKQIAPERRRIWIKKFVGDYLPNSAKSIAEDIIRS